MEKLCFLCCLTYTPEQLSAAEGNNLVEDLEKRPEFQEFCRDLSLDSKGLVCTLKNDWKYVSLCGDCLESVGKAVESSKLMTELEVVVKRMQLELFAKVRDLKSAVDKRRRELRKVVGIVKESEDDVLLRRKRSVKTAECGEDDVVKFRKRVVEVSAEVTKFSGRLIQKVKGSFEVIENKDPSRGSTNKKHFPEAFNMEEYMAPAEFGDLENDEEALDHADLYSGSCLKNSIEGLTQASPGTSSAVASRPSSSSIDILENEPNGFNDSNFTGHNEIVGRNAIWKTFPTRGTSEGASMTQKHEVSTPCKKTRSMNADEVHTPEQPFQCEHCHNTFKLKGNLTKHIKSVHLGLKLFTCDICHKRVSHKANLTRHRRTHTGEKPFQCHLCDARFARKYTLENHIRQHTGEKPFRCNNCTQRFRYLHELKRHERCEHRGEKILNA